MTESVNALPKKQGLSKFNIALLSLSLLWLIGGVGYKIYSGKNAAASQLADTPTPPEEVTTEEITTNAVATNNIEITAAPEAINADKFEGNVSLSNPNGFAETYYVPQKIAAKGNKLRIGVFGDSMADGLWAGLVKETAIDGQQDKIAIYKFSKQGTGLANYEYANLHDKALSQIDDKPIDIAIIAVGANDQRGITGSGGSVSYGSPRWAGRYSSRVDELARIFLKRGIPVYWVGLPIIRDNEADKLAQQLCRIYHDKAAANNISYISVYKKTAGSDGKFSSLLMLPGERTPKHLRAPDGVHFTTEGYRIIAIPVIQTINRDLKTTDFELMSLSLDKKN